MADLWQQFHSLPKAIRDAVATPQAIAAVDDLERQFPKVELASFVMRMVVHEFPFSALGEKLIAEYGIDASAVATISSRLRTDVFTGDVADYLGLKPDTAPSTTAVPPPPAPQVPKPNIVTAPPTIPLPVITPVSAAVAPMSAAQPAPIAAPPVLRPSVPTVPVVKKLPVVQTPPLPTVPIAQPSQPIGAVAPTTQYSDEDAAEIEQQASRLRTISTLSPNQDMDARARQLLTEQNLAFSDELLDRRSVSIVKARLKGVRTTEETAEMLSRDAKIGGIGLDRELAAALAAAAERVAGTLKDRGMVREPEVLPPPPIPPVPMVAQQKPAAMPPLRRDVPVSTTPTTMPNMTEAPRASRPIVRPADIPTLAPLPTPPPAVTVKPTTSPVIQRPRGTDRPTMADVVRPTVALGPAEEMRSMTLIEFRRLGQGATDAAKKILDTFAHLQRESFSVWADAVAGWRQSAVYQLYVDMGRESLEKGVPITQIIAERSKSGQPYVSEHEFGALSDLNRQLQM